MNTELSLFVREALAKGVSRADIEKALKKANWHEDEVKMALAGYAEGCVVLGDGGAWRTYGAWPLPPEIPATQPAA